MKKILCAIALVAPALAGTPAPVVTAPAPTPAPAVSPWAVELGANYKECVSTKDIVKHPAGQAPEVDTWGFDITGLYKLNAKNALTLRAGYDHGCIARTYTYYKNHVELNDYSLMPGYRFTQPITDKLGAFIGANAGIISSSEKSRVVAFGNAQSPYQGVGKAHNTDFGFAYSAEVGLKYDLCPNTYVFGAYEFSGNTTAPKAYHGWRSRHPVYNGVRAGIGINF